MPRMRASTSRRSGSPTRSVLLIRITSAKAIWFFASGASRSRSFRYLASATVTTASSLVFLPTFSSTKKVCATGAGSASPVVSTMMPSNLPLRRMRPSMIRMRSPRTVQQTQPLFISNTSSSAPTTSSLSMPISPNSFTMTANLRPCGSDRMRLSRVVLPAPRYPVSTVTGILSVIGPLPWGLYIGEGTGGGKPCSPAFRDRFDAAPPPPRRHGRLDRPPHGGDRPYRELVPACHGGGAGRRSADALPARRRLDLAVRGDHLRPRHRVHGRGGLDPAAGRACPGRHFLRRRVAARQGDRRSPRRAPAAASVRRRARRRLP